MNFKLNEHNGMVGYLTRQNGAMVECKTKIESAEWTLDQCKPEKSGEFEGYPIKAVMNGNEYFFAGEWLMGGAKDVLGEDAPQSAANAPCGPDYCEIDAGEGYSRKGADRPQKRRRAKDVVCE